MADFFNEELNYENEANERSLAPFSTEPVGTGTETVMEANVVNRTMLQNIQTRMDDLCSLTDMVESLADKCSTADIKGRQRRERKKSRRQRQQECD